MNGLLVDDDEVYARVLQRSLARRGWQVHVAFDSSSALDFASANPPDFALLDLKLKNDSGLSLIKPLRALRADMMIILVTGYASVATAVDAIKRGADNYLPKPVTANALVRILSGEEDLPSPDDSMMPLSRIEWEHISQAMKDCGGNISAAARLLGMHRRSLQRKLAKRPAPQLQK
jgi:two-component system response regulator RegA